MSREPRFVRTGWEHLHQAVLEAGAEVNIDHLDYPDFESGNYIYPDSYAAYIGPLIEKAQIDFETLGFSSFLVEKTIWKWLGRVAYQEYPDTWSKLLAVRTRTDLYLAFLEIKPKRRFPGCPDHAASDLISILRCGHWLVTECPKRKRNSIEPALWGLALIGAYWQRKAKAGYCKYCFRKARLGSTLCTFHWQGDKDPRARVQSAIQYRLARRVAELRHHEKCDDVISRLTGPTDDYEAATTMLASILYPTWPAEGWASELRDLKDALRQSPRTVNFLREPDLYKMEYEQLAALLRRRVDPFEFDDFAWPVKVIQAEIWFELEERIQKRVRGPGRKTAMLVSKAIQLAKDGMTGGEIAKHFQVAPATVSRWKERYPDFAKAFSRP